MMSGFLGVPIDAAYHLVSLFASFLTPLLGGLAAAAAIVGFTMVVRLLLLPLSYRAMRGIAAQARVAPLAQDLRNRYAGQPATVWIIKDNAFDGTGFSFGDNLVGNIPTESVLAALTKLGVVHDFTSTKIAKSLALTNDIRAKYTHAE